MSSVPEYNEDIEHFSDEPTKFACKSMDMEGILGGASALRYGRGENP